ncbi:hypothetical protein D3C72_815000 [compost metagenome]
MTLTPILPRLAAQYLRMSTDHQRYSLENQAAAISAYAKAEGYEIVKSYVDAGRSGVTTKRRGGLSQLLADVVGGKANFNTILVLDVSRWGRYQDADEAGHYEFLCRAAGVDIVYSGEGFTEGLAGSVFKHMKRVMAAEYSRELSAKVRASKQRNAGAGNAPGGTCVYGLARQIVNADGSLGRILERGERKSRPEQVLRMVPEGKVQSTTVRRIFRMFVDEHLQPVRIAERLNTSGSVWLDNTSWNKTRVANILRCELLVGRQPFGKTTHTLGKPIQYNARETWGSVQVFRPIVSLKMFKAAQTRLRELGGHHVKTEREMLDDLRSVHALHGRLNIQLIDATPGIQKSSAYFARFGTLGRAYKLIGIPYAPRERGRYPDGARLSREDVLAGIRRVHLTNGRINMALCHADQSLPSLGWIRAEFGGLTEAFDAAGVTHRSPHGPRKGCRHPNINPETGAFERGNGIHTGPNGGRYFVTPSGRKRYGLKRQ